MRGRVNDFFFFDKLARTPYLIFWRGMKGDVGGGGGGRGK